VGGNRKPEANKNGKLLEQEQSARCRGNIAETESFDGANEKHKHNKAAKNQNAR
jgi:3-methyladenine DNA glycosylase Mpg